MMPTIAIIDGVKIQMFYDDHTPPHFHAIIGDQEVLIAIRTLDVIRGIIATCQATPSAGLGERASRRLGAQLDQVSGRGAAGEDLSDAKGTR